MPIVDYQPSLDHLLHISHVLGCNDRLVQAGGGNTSVKCADGKTMLIKASGTPLGQMEPARGWVAVRLDTVRSLFESPELRKLPAAEREQRVLGVLSDAIIEPKDARPSVETPLHALLDTVIMHSHPVAANALGCLPDGETALAAVCKDVSQRPPLWIPYIDPGSTLAFAVADRIEQYAASHGGPPDVVLQPNHGLFVAASTAHECAIKHQQIVENAEHLLLERFPEAIDPQTTKRIADAVSNVYGADTLVRPSKRPELVQAARGELAETFAGALSPDHVVYTGPRGLIVDGDIGQPQLEAALTDFKSATGVLPRLIVVRGQTVCVVGQSEKKVDAAEALAVSAVQTALLTGNKPRFLDGDGVAFIMNWEAEHYRAKQ
ncbi:MAG: hypothetical protein GF331_07735 [Chitinivibrionales bacterium]|nr:hypothetical protein [Chitinivibrionales bacterium]